MTTQAELDANTKAIGQHASICWTCGGTPNPDNFGGLCDPCYGAHRARLSSAAKILRAHGQENTDTGRALTALGY